MNRLQQVDARFEPVMMPAVFISHGSPMVAVQHGSYQDALAEFGRKVRPSAIVAISAHWGSSSAIGINGATRHSTMHDFGGFPPALYELTYNAPGSPELAEQHCRTPGRARLGRQTSPPTGDWTTGFGYRCG